ncbi:MAG: imidazole glycerol phosphate synthase subunit HisF [Bacteroidetes bacterium]|nr:imidazole glycerol phosphate synthase subunit HisF [Bacteroidota bacterium]
MTEHEIKIKFTAYASIDELDAGDQALCLEAVNALKSSHSPYSKFRVGVAMRLQSGKILHASNQENVAYPSGLCAERVALFHWGANHAGDPVELAWNYSQQGADELVFLDITATHERRKTMVELVKAVARQVNIPFTIGGGINEIADADALLNAGADKISINSAAVRNPELIDKLANAFGVQFVIVAVDTRHIGGQNLVHLNGGRIATEKETFDWILEAESRGAGEILLTSMDHDGTKSGFDNEFLKKVNDAVHIPVIASGGAGSVQHFVDVFEKTGVDAALAASVFHYGEILIPDLKEVLRQHQIEVRQIYN